MDGLNAAIEKMRAEGLGDAAVESFTRQYERLAGGESGTLAEADIANVRAAADGATEVFMSAASPGVIEMFMANRYYPSTEEYLFALADAPDAPAHTHVPEWHFKPLRLPGSVLAFA